MIDKPVALLWFDGYDMSKNGEEKREKNTQNHIVCRANISRHRILQSGAMYISLIFHTTMLCQVPSTFYPFNSGQRAESSGGGVRPLLPLARKHRGDIEAFATNDCLSILLSLPKSHSWCAGKKSATRTAPIMSSLIRKRRAATTTTTTKKGGKM